MTPEKKYKTTEKYVESELKEPDFEFGKVYTYGDYLKFEIEEMVEIIRGKIFRMSPAPRTNHQIISSNMHFRLRQQIEHSSCKVFHAPTDIVLPIENKKRNKSTTVVQPDICVVCNPKIIEEKAIFGSPDFVIEIIAGKDIKKDTQLKFDVYEEAGVGEYWLVFADIKLVEVFILENGKYQRLNAFSEDDVVPVKTIPGLFMSIDNIFEGV